MEKLLNARQVADWLGISPDTVLDWFEADLLPGFKPNGRVVRFRASEIHAWLETHRRGPRDAAASIAPPTLEVIPGGA